MNKKFSELTKEEIAALSDEEFNNIPSEEKKSCYDCIFLKAIVNWWCTNSDAIKLRGTAIPGVIKCPYWSGVSQTKNYNSKL